MIKCDVCGGPLSINAGGQSATCKVCGMEHSIERVREMLAGQGVSPIQATDQTPEPEKARADAESVSKLPMEKIAAQISQADTERRRQMAELTLLLARIIDQYFGEYNVTYMADVATIDPILGQDAFPIQFLFQKNGHPALAIAVATPSGYESSKAMRNGRQTCLNAGIPYIAFYTGMPNEPVYIRQRIAAAMEGRTVQYAWPKREPKPKKKRFWNKWL